jgi:Protein of unknown function (DUF3108)
LSSAGHAALEVVFALANTVTIFEPYWLGIWIWALWRNGTRILAMMRYGLIFGLFALVTPVQAADVITASFDVSLAGARIMKADYSATLDATTYSADLSAKTVGVSKMFSKIRLIMSANGSFSEAGFRPASYAYSRKKNDKLKERNLTFSQNGSLVTEGADYGDAIMAALNNKVMDPLSMLLKLSRTAKPCNGKHRAFDGRDVFDVSLASIGTSGGVLTCKLVYTPVAGGDVEGGDTDAITYEISLAPVANKGSYIPVRISGSTKGVGFEVNATSVTVNGEALSY